MPSEISLDSPDSQGAKRRRWLRRGLLLCLALVMLSGLFRHRLTGYALVRLADAGGLLLEFDELSGSLWSNVELRGLRLVSKPEETSGEGSRGNHDSIRIRASRLRAEFDLPRLAQGDLNGLLRLELEGATGDLELSQANPESTPPAASDNPPAWYDVLPSALPDLDLEVLRFRLVLASGESLETEALTLRSSELAREYDLQAKELSYETESELRSSSLESRLRYQDRRVDILSLELGRELSAEGFVRLEEQFTWDGLARVGEGEVRSSGEMGPDTRQLSLTCDSVSLAEALRLGRAPSPSDPEGILQLDVRSLDSEVSTWPALQGSCSLNDAVIAGRSIERFNADLQTVNGATELADLVLEGSGVHLEVEHLRVESLETVESALTSASGAIRLTCEDLNRVLEAETQEDNPPISIDLEGSLQAGVATLRTATLVSSSALILVNRGTVTLGPTPETVLTEADLDVAFTANIEQLGDFAGLLGSPEWSGQVNASGQLRGSWPALRGNAALNSTQLVIPGAVLSDVNAELSVEGPRLELLRLESTGPEHHVLARGALEVDTDRLRLELEELLLERGTANLALLAPATCQLVNSRPTALTTFELQGSAGHLRVGLAGEDTNCLEVLVQDLNSDELIDPSWKEAPDFSGATGTLRACWSETAWTRIETDFAVESVSLARSSERYATRLQADWTDGVLTVTDLNIRSEAAPLLQASGFVGLDAAGLVGEKPLQLSLDGRFTQPRQKFPGEWQDHVPANGDVHLVLDLQGTPRALEGSIELAMTDLELLGRTDEELTYLSPSELSLRMALTDEVRLNELTWRGPNGHRLTATGKLETRAGMQWLEPGWESRLEKVPAEAEAQLSSESLAELGDWLRDWFELQSNFRSGHVEGKVAASGPLGDLEPRVQLQVEQATVRIRGVPPLTELSAAMGYEDSRLNLNEVRGELGAAPFEGSASVDWTGPEAMLTAEVRGTDLLFIRNSDVKIRGDLDIQLSDRLVAPLVTGKLTIAQARLVSPVEVLDLNLQRKKKPARRGGFYLFRFTDPPLRDVRFDMEIDSRGPFEIDNNVADGSFRPELRLTGTGEVPTLEGTLYVDETRVKLPSQSVTVTAGSVRFTRSDPFVPQVEIRAEQRIKGYDVDITVLGPYDRPEVHLTSTPPLANDDLTILLLTGQAPNTGASRTGRDAAQSVAVYLARDYITRWLSDPDPDAEASWLERFDLQTGRDITRSGAETMEGSFRLDSLRSTDRDAFYLTAENDQYDFINFGLRFELHFR